ncbi:STAS domain-containing protein [Bradyrhizobium sp. USDA 4353]
MTDANATNPTATDAAASVAYALPQMLDLTQAVPLRDEMVRLAAAGSIALDASGVERMSTPCVQILLAAARGAKAANKPFKITQASELFRTAVAELGLRNEFEDWME